MDKRLKLLMVVALLFSSSVNSALLERLGGAAAYDDVLDITWLTDANLSGIDTWANQQTWAGNLNALGYDDWRLASMSVSAGLPIGTTPSVVNCNIATELACRDNELGYMYTYNLASITGFDKSGTHTVGDVTLTDIQIFYWAGSDVNANIAWSFLFNGSQSTGSKLVTGNGYGWAVRSGDVSSVPVPAATWLFGSGLIGLIGIARRKKV